MHSSVLKSLPYGLCPLFLLWTLLGCSGRPGRIAPPKVDPEEIAGAALEFYDQDSDGTLNADELKACPPLVDALPVYDTSKDGMLSKAELTAGIGSWARRGIGAMVVPFSVRLDGRPLAGAEVKLNPAPFLLDLVQPASGVADHNGAGSLKMSDENRPSNAPARLPVMQPGLYLVEITHPSIEIPAEYNIETTLGLEAGIAGQNPNGVLWELKTKKR